MIDVSCWQIFLLLDSEVAKTLYMHNGLEFIKDMSFLNLIAELNVFNVVKAYCTLNNIPTMLDLLLEIELILMTFS